MSCRYPQTANSIARHCLNLAASRRGISIRAQHRLMMWSASCSHIWEETLGIRPIDLEDSFFELGGHSLLAIKLLDAIEKQFGQALKLATLFEAPTIRGQATLVRQPGTRAAPTCAVAVQSGGNRLPLFFVSGFGGAILPFHRLAMELGNDQPAVCARSQLAWRRSRRDHARGNCSADARRHAQDSAARALPPCRFLAWRQSRLRDRTTTAPRRANRSDCSHCSIALHRASRACAPFRCEPCCTSNTH